MKIDISEEKRTVAKKTEKVGILMSSCFVYK